MRHLLGFSCLLFPWCLLAQPYTDTGPEWRSKELWRAKGLFNERDLTPVDGAFDRHDLRMLWTYFIEANNGQCGRGRDIVENASLKTRYTEPEMMDLNDEIRTKAGDYLRRMPGHAKVFGDDIEELAQKEDTVSQRVVRFKALGSLGSEESIQQLGRFLFDKRNPDKDSKKYYVTPPANDMYAAMWLQTALGKRSPLGAGDLYADGGMKYGSDDKLRQWWLTSADAAPYRQGLLASGVALPPNYPALPETATRPDDVTTRDSSAESVSDATGWGIGLVLLALVATSVWLAARRQAQKSR
ncbi:MAG: hypothetical protein IAE77_29885 [Prosthecobacter sp.]|uniref:hypothetical protein n=1 Tax=Prosthecobacter sp. TaxID=1965333 RepID=UPI0019F0721E|nr:hypothetical protein [Prosthecobacter sp.]MBE2287706.1 hypothetical protein [Prosthecobacter sp.]